MWILLCALHISLLPAQQRPIEAADCVEIRRVPRDLSMRREITINRQGSLAAYLVQAPNLKTNRNDVQLHILPLSGDMTQKDRVVFRAEGISQLQWLEDGKHVAVLVSDRVTKAIVLVDVVRHTRETILESAGDVREFSVDGKGNRVVYGTEVAHIPPPSPSQDPAAIASGYRIAFANDRASMFPRRSINVLSKGRDGVWKRPIRLMLMSPFTSRELTHFPYILSLRLSLSPNGRYLTLSYLEHAAEMSAEWRDSAQIKSMMGRGYDPEVTVLEDLATNVATVPIGTAWSMSIPLWSNDGRAFVLTAAAPINSKWEDDAIRQRKDPSQEFSLFWVDPTLKQVATIPAHPASINDQPLLWKSSGELLVQTNEDAITTFVSRGGAWNELSRLQLPFPASSHLVHMATDGTSVIGDYQDPATPPEIFRYIPGGRMEVLTALNPQFQLLQVAPTRQIRWETSTGVAVTGLLFMPPNYVVGTRYPLVIGTKPVQSDFFCDSGWTHYPSFAPQPLADSGIMYLVETPPRGGTATDDPEHYPKGYPGGIGEAEFNMDKWDSAISALDRMGIIDPKRIGIIGYSHTGWLTEFILAHSRNHFRAATTADNIQYNLSEYWLNFSPSMAQSFESLYGGPPYGQSLRNWETYSLSFNLEKIHTPLLLETMGYGTQYDTQMTIPLNLAVRFETVVGLSRLKRPVELYYYPTEEHQLDHPRARLASLQRNVDWYRFWLQGYERPQPEDVTQYDRWRVMRGVQDDAAGTSAWRK